MVYIKRTILAKAKNIINQFPIMAITGPRQSGKTTFLRHEFSDYKYFSLENPDTLEASLDDPRSFLGMNGNRLIIDEAQKNPKLFSYLQGIADDPENQNKYILSGSQNFLLLEKITQSLAGRIGMLTLLPLTKDETGMDYSLEKFVYKGFYPRLYSHDIRIEDMFFNYIDTYVEKDVRQILNIKNILEFRKFLKLCAGQVGQILNLSSMANQLGISHNTVREWINILEASYITFRLPPYYTNLKKQLIKTPKLYFYDTGLLSNLLGLRSVDQLRSHYNYGIIFENMIISEFIKQNYNKGTKPDIYFIRDNNGREIGLLFEKNTKLYAAEIKSSRTINSRFFSNIKFWQQSGLLAGQNYLIWAGDQNEFRNDIEIISWKNISKLAD